MCLRHPVCTPVRGSVCMPSHLNFVTASAAFETGALLLSLLSLQKLVHYVVPNSSREILNDFESSNMIMRFLITVYAVDHTGLFYLQSSACQTITGQTQAWSKGCRGHTGRERRLSHEVTCTSNSPIQHLKSVPESQCCMTLDLQINRFKEACISSYFSCFLHINNQNLMRAFVWH